MMPEFAEAKVVVPSRSLGIELRLGDVYRRVEF
jgi:hypothetical protein